MGQASVLRMKWKLSLGVEPVSSPEGLRDGEGAVPAAGTRSWSALVEGRYSLGLTSWPRSLSAAYSLKKGSRKVCKASPLGIMGKRVKRHTRKTRTRAPGESAPLCCPAAATVINPSFCHCSRVGDRVPGVCFSSFLTTIHEV